MKGLTYLVLLLGIYLAAADFAKYEAFINQQAKNDTFVRMFEEHLRQFADPDQGKLKSGNVFHCKPFPGPVTRSEVTVHQLTPMDIRVVGALGDSITAGTGIKADTVLGLLKQDRGLSWSIGGDDSIADVETLPNIVRVYNPDINGFSKGWGPVWLKSVSRLNVADPGDKSEDIPGQAVELVKRMKADKNINFEEDWKLITLFVGGNDLCDFCKDKKKYSAENYVAHIQTALDYLHEHVPRAYINMVDVLDIAIVRTLNANLVCNALHLYLCRCAAFPRNSEAEREMQEETQRYRDLADQLILSGRYDTRDDFTVVVQPFFTKTEPPKIAGTDDPDLSYFAPDCFHLSLKGHRAAADALWNNMIEPIGKKRTVWSPGEKVECPSETSPFFYTYKNSGSQEVQSFGAMPDPDAGNQPLTNSDATAGTDSSSSAPAVTVLIIAAVVIGTGILLLAVYRRQRPQRKTLILARPRKRMDYTQL